MEKQNEADESRLMDAVQPGGMQPDERNAIVAQALQSIDSLLAKIDSVMDKNEFGADPEIQPAAIQSAPKWDESLNTKTDSPENN